MTRPDLGPRVARLEEDLTSISDTLIDIKETVDGHTSEFAAVRGTLAEHGTRLAAIEGSLSEILRRLDPHRPVRSVT